MIGRALRICAVLVTGMILVTACSSDRPRELSMDEVAPCELLSPTTLRQLHVPNKPHSLEGVVEGTSMDGDTCLYRLRSGNEVTISAITNRGIDWQIDGRFEHRKSKDVPRIHGFRTVRVWNGGERLTPDLTCKLYIDVAGGQSLRIKVGQSSDEEDPPTCETARRFAKPAMKALVASQS